MLDDIPLLIIDAASCDVKVVFSPTCAHRFYQVYFPPGNIDQQQNAASLSHQLKDLYFYIFLY